MEKSILFLILFGVISFGLVMGPKFLAPPLPPGFQLPSEFTPPKTGPIHPYPQVNFTEFKHFSLTSFFGYSVGNLFGLILVRFILTSVWFVIAVYFLRKYTKSFYGGRKTPLSWWLLIAGMLITNIAEIGENFVFHEWPYLGILELEFLFILPHLWGGFLIALGGYYLYKEIKA